MLTRRHRLLSQAPAIAGIALLACGCESGGSDAGAARDAERPASAGATAAAPSEAAAAQDTDPAVAVIAERLPYAEVKNQLVYGHFVFPADMVDPLPAVIMIHNQWGLNDHMRAQADRLAGEGYIVLAIDLFGGSTSSNPETARLQMVSVLENPESARENIRQAYSFVSDTAGAPRVGSLGFDFGGGWSLQTAAQFPNDLDAAVIVYGQVTDEHDLLRPIATPILGLFAGQDRNVTRESVQRFEVALESLRKNYEIHIYANAGHSFANPAAATYDREVAEDAWLRILAFFDLHLRIGAADSP